MGHVVAVLEQLVIMVTVLVRSSPRQLGARGVVGAAAALLGSAAFAGAGLLLANAKGPAGFAHGGLNAPAGWLVFSIGALFVFAAVLNFLRDVGTTPLVVARRVPDGLRLGSTAPVVAGHGLLVRPGDTVRLLARPVVFRTRPGRRPQRIVQWRLTTDRGRTVVTSRVLPSVEQVERLRAWLGEAGITLVVARGSLTSP